MRLGFRCATSPKWSKYEEILSRYFGGVHGRTNILPEIGFIRLPTVLALIPVSKSTWWEGIKNGRFPKPIKLGPRTTAWRVEDIRHLIEHPVPSN